MSGRVIWERVVNEERIRQRTRRFRMRFGIPAALILVVVLIFGGATNAIGAAIVLTFIGLSWGGTVRVQNLSDRSNPTLVVDRGRIVLGNRDVVMADVKRFTTAATALQTSVFGSFSELQIGKALFRMDNPGQRAEPDIVEFGWPNLEEDQIVALGEALKRELRNKWVEPEDLIEPNELPDERGGRSRRRRGPGRTLWS